MIESKEGLRSCLNLKIAFCDLQQCLNKFYTLTISLTMHTFYATLLDHKIGSILFLIGTELRKPRLVANNESSVLNKTSNPIGETANKQLQQVKI